MSRQYSHNKARANTRKRLTACEKLSSSSVRKERTSVTLLSTRIEHVSPTCYTMHLPNVNEEASSATLYTKLDDSLIVDEQLFDELWNLHPPEYGSIKMFGKNILTPRWHAVYGNRDYKFTGVTHAANPIPQAVDGQPHLFQRLIDWVAGDSGHTSYNSLLVNWYADSTQYMGPHTDAESSLQPSAPIYSFSFGSPRQFVIHNRHNLKEQYSLTLPNNSLLVMRGAMQRHYKHSVPKVKRISGRRINITLRHFKR